LMRHSMAWPVMTMSSYLTDRPRPVPLPTSFVVKNGTKGLSSTSGVIPQPLSLRALPDGQACSFYGAALAETLRVLTGFEGAMVHMGCRGRGDDTCRWQAAAVEGYS